MATGRDRPGTDIRDTMIKGPSIIKSPWAKFSTSVALNTSTKPKAISA